MSVVTTTNFDKITRTAREMTEAQRDSYEALAENLAALQRRSVGLAQNGIGFLRLQSKTPRRPSSGSPAARGWRSSSSAT